VKGATGVRHGDDVAVAVSIHAPVKGATVRGRIFGYGRCFNPRAREGRDQGGCCAYWFPSSVSIHAPVKGATRARHVRSRQAPVSIHAPVKGATTGTADHMLLRWFQSTRP